MNDVEEMVSLGQRLREARETKNMSVEDVAKQLRISVALIHAIESDDYDFRGTEAVFMRGYIRTYAKLVELSEDECGDEFQRVGLYEKVNVSGNLQKIKVDNLSAKNKYVRIVTYIIIAILIILLLVWWYSHYADNSKSDKVPISSDIQSVTFSGQQADDSRPANTISSPVINNQVPLVTQQNNEQVQNQSQVKGEMQGRNQLQGENSVQDQSRAKIQANDQGQVQEQEKDKVVSQEKMQKSDAKQDNNLLKTNGTSDWINPDQSK